MKCLNPNCKDPTFLENLGQLLGVQPDFCPSCGAPTTSSKDGTESEESKNAESSASKQALSVQSCGSQSVTSNDGLAQIQDHQSAGPNDDEKHRSGVSDVNEDKDDSSSRSRETQQNNKTQVQYELQEPQSLTQLVVANEEVKTPGRQGTPLKEPESETISRDGWQSSQQERYQPGLQEQRQLAEQLQDGKEMQHEEKQQQQQQLQNEKENSKEKQKLLELEQQQKKKEKQQNQHQQQQEDEEEEQKQQQFQEVEGNEEEKQKLLERRQEKQQQEGEEENKEKELSLQQHQKDEEAKKAEQKKKLPKEQQGNQLQQVDNEKEEDVKREEVQQSQLQTDLNQEQQSEQQQNQRQLLKEQQNQVLEKEELQRKLQQQEQTEIEHPQQPHQYEKQNQAKQELSLQQEQCQHNQEHQKTTTELQQQQMLLEIKHQELLVKNQTQEQIILQQQKLLEHKLQQSPNTSAPNNLTSPQSASNDDSRGPSPSSNVLSPPLDEYSNAGPSQTIDASNDRSKATYAAVASNKNIENSKDELGTPIAVVATVTTTPTVTTTTVIYMGGTAMDNSVKSDKDTNPSSQQNDNRNRVIGDASSNDKTGENQGELSEQEVLTFTEDGHVKAQLKPEHKQTGKEKSRNADKTGTTVGTQSASSTSHQMTTRSSSRSDYMKVVFHALLSPHFKFDQSKGDKVVIRGAFPLSGWKNDDLQMTPLCPYKGYTLVSLEIQIPLLYANKGIPYKYVVIKYNDNKKPKYLWEEIIGFPSSIGVHTNRLLVIPEAYRKTNATWHQYDDGIFPTTSVWDTMPWKDYVDPSEGQHFAMEAMLPDWNRLGVETRGGTKKGTEFMETVNQVIYCMTHLKVETAGKIQPLARKKFNLQQALLSYLTPRIEENLSLQPSSDESAYAYRLATSLVITGIISNVLDRYKDCVPTDDQFKLVFRCLALDQSIMEHAKLLKVLELLKKYFTKNNLKTKFSEAILHLCQYVINYCNGVNEWLLAMPLVHFLTESSSPYTEPVPVSSPDALADKSTNPWGTHTLDLAKVKQQANLFPNWSPINLISEVKQAFKMDPLLQRTFMSILPLADMGVCAKQANIPAHEVCWALAKTFHEKSTAYIREEEGISLMLCFNHMNVRLTDGASDSHSELKIQCEEELKSLCIALSRVVQSLLLSVKDNIHIICVALDIMSKTLEIIKKLFLNKKRNERQGSDEANSFHRTQLEDTMNKVIEKLKRHFYEDLNQSIWEKELEVYSKLYYVKFEDEEMRTVWGKGLEDHLEARLEKVDDIKKIDLYVKVDLKEFHKELERFLRETAFKAIRNITESGRHSDHNKAFETMRIENNDNPDVRKVGDLMSVFLHQSWPKDDVAEEELLTHILSWKPMGNYLDFFNKNRHIFTPESQCHLVQAKTLLDAIQQKISNQTITVNVLRILRNSTERFVELVVVIKKDESKQQNGQDEFKKTFQDTVKLLEKFEQEREELQSFLQLNFILANVDVKDIKSKMSMDVSTHEIKDLANYSDDMKPLVIFFGLSYELKEMISRLHRIYKSEIFQNIWKDTFENTKQKNNSDKIDLEELLESVWKPAFANCCLLLKGVARGTISMADVDQYFEVFKDSYDRLKADLLTVVDVCAMPMERTVITKQVDKICSYHKQKACTEAADKVLEFQRTMELDENGFLELEEFRQQICCNSKRTPLNSLQDGIEGIGVRLTSITPERMECLDAIMESKEFINWLKSELSDASEVSVLVDFAMTSAGEGDLESYRVRSLHTATSAFKPIIFDLKKEDNFNSLMDMLGGIWDALDENEKLPKQLRDTSRHLEWIKNVKDFHGSGVMSSLRQVETILGHGTLNIGRLDSSNELDITKVITLTLAEDKAEELQKEKYTLEELKDLQSKLMLITGKTSGKKEDVDTFSEVLQGALSVGKAFLKLCEAGEVSHLDWREEFRCSRKLHYDVTEVLRDRSNKLTECFEEWTSILEVQRLECNELNYFTAKQLLYLRKEIADLRRGRPLRSLEVQIYSLLSNVLPEINASLLQQALIVIDIDIDEPLTAEFKEVDLREKYANFFDKASDPDLGFSEEVALAAIVACDCPDDHADLLLWCIKNNQKEELIADMCKKGSRDRKFQTLFPGVCHEDKTEEIVEKMDVDEFDGENEEENLVSRLDQTLDGRYLSLQELSTLLQTLTEKTKKDDEKRMEFPEYLERGKPNLMIVPQSDILATVIGLYLESDVSPSRYEVLVCTQDTSLEEVELLWRRALANKGDKFYCLANADKLSLDDSVKVKKAFDKLEGEYNNDYQLVIICSSEQETKSQIATAFDKFRVKGAPRCPRPKEVLLHLKNYFKAPPVSMVHFGRHEIEWIPAAEVQTQCQTDSRLSVLIISSERSGTGKSLMVQDFARALEAFESNQQMSDLLKETGDHVSQYVIAPLLGKSVNVSDIVGFLLPYSMMSDVPVSRIFHFDVSPSVESGLESVLFNLLYLGSIQDQLGRVWKRSPHDLYVVEMTSACNKPNKTNRSGTPTRYFYNELPSIHCITPNQVLKKMDKPSDTNEFIPLFNDGKFYSEAVQRVFQYLYLLDNQPDLLHHFEFDQETIRSNRAECLRLLTNYCGVQDPSWSELQHFVNFLNYQLSDCERSTFCQMENIDDVLEGFRLFVVQFMTIMSQDFSTRSLGNDNIRDDQDDAREEEEDIAQFQLRRKWESSPHPYLFFNHPDHQTFTFFGFRIDENGNLIEPNNGEVLKEGLMARRLRTGLHVQLVNFEEDFESLDKSEKIEKICQVLGVEWPCDPDESYELTEDNAKKIMAIHMRFRCGIPVVIIGETGCGKTKLIRYLCGLQRGYDGPRNMLLVKVHGGTTFRDIETKVQQAKRMAKKNMERGVETVLFFDEVNTTEALDLVKEVMVDGRMNGVPLGQDAEGLRFIAACNPYRKHTETMIRKLESAGLGYSVKTDDITDRIGRVPLRHLVYRVHALPESMQSLIWDFGQLNPEIEMLYIRQIVKRHISMEDHDIPHDDELVEAIANVLGISQQYMREQKNECSFVSLRDVERTMNVMIWFYQHREVFRPLLEKIASEGHVPDAERGMDHRFEHSEDSSSSDDQSDTVKPTEKDLPYYFKQDKSKDDVNLLLEEPSLPTASGDVTRKIVEELSLERELREQNEDVTRHVRRFHKFLGLSHLEIQNPSEPMPSTSRVFVEDDDPVCARLIGIYPPTAEDSDDEIEIAQITTAAANDDGDDDDDLNKPLDPVTWSLILSVGVCYHAKLQEREQYRQTVADAFHRPCCLYGGADRIIQEISRCQKAMLNELDLGPNIARNSALSENVFMMVVCIELRIPLFVIGKPGSSKSLAKTVVAANMQGDASKSKLFKSFKEVQMSAHQCSPLSTPEGIQETFRQCSNLQKGKNTDKFVSVVVLDEVGLAEDSPLLPLKTLHPLLEDGVTSSDDIIETDEKPERVAFIGISNWALDPAKMNRGIMLSRDVPGVRELEESAMGICASDKNIQGQVKLIIPALARAYSEVYEQQQELEVLKESKKDEFFGLRDFYCLIKMVYNQVKGTHRVPNWTMIEYAIRRNFGGLDVGFDPVGIFRKHLDFLPHDEQEDIQVSSLDLIKSSLDKDPEEEDSRYLLILTENHAALTIVQQYLTESKKETDENEPVLIFGSSFPKDLEYTQVCRNINDIKVCMETGRTVILLNMERLYEGLYDALNQYYVQFGGNKFVDLGLGTHRVKCKVDPQFRLIVIAEKSTVYKDFPIPLINRLEKHFLVLSSSLTEPQRELVQQLEIWVKRFSTIETPKHLQKRKFTLGDAFVGYHDDTIPSVVFQVCSKLRQDGTNLDDENRVDWEETVLSESKRLLVQCCTPDAIVRLHTSSLKYEADSIWNMYIKEQHHSSLADFLRHREHDQGLLIQISTHSRLLSQENLEEVAQALDLHTHYVEAITLQQFQTEQQFRDCIGNFFAHLGGDRGLLVVQCIPSDLAFNLLACARHLLLKERAEIKDDVPVHIIVIIQLPRIPGGYPDFVGFQGQQWESVHIDELSDASFYVPSLEDVKDKSLSQLFKSSIDDDTQTTLDAVDVLRQCIQSAAQRIDDGPSRVNRATRRIVILLELISRENYIDQGESIHSFPNVLIRRVYELLVKKDERSPHEGTKWSTSEAMEHTDLQETGTYRKALWRKIQTAVVPIFSEVIAFIDRNGNLESLHRGHAWLKDLWLQIFQDNRLTELHYSSFLKDDVIRSHVPVTSSGRDLHVFENLLPFSWLIRERVDDMLSNAKGVAESSNSSVVECLRGMMSNSDTAEIMNIINGNQEAVERYIHDFVHMNYNPVGRVDHELVARAIIVTTRQLHYDNNSSAFNFPDVALVHEAYYRIDVRITCFRQLIQCNPSIVDKVLDAFTVNESSMTLDTIALLVCLESMDPSEVDMCDNEQRKVWCDHVISIRASAESIMSKLKEIKYDSDDKVLDTLERCRHLWERITAIRLFIEHVYMSGKKVKLNERNISTLCKALDEETDFSKAQSVETIEYFLLECIKTFPSTSKSDMFEFRRRCNSFFMELTSLLCFGDKSTLDPDVFDIFMRYITGSGSSKTKNFSPFPDFEVDKTPVVRSFLLQQLLTSSDDDSVKKYIQRYLVEARELSPDEEHVTQVCQLTVDCMEDSFATQMTQQNIHLPLLIGVLTRSVSISGELLVGKQDHQNMLDVKVLEAIANIRHALTLSAEWIFKSQITDDIAFKDEAVISALDKLLNVLRELFSRLIDRAPVVYLLKQLARRFGGASVRELTQRQELQWLIPRDLEGFQFTQAPDDRFVVYGDHYTKTRDALAQALMSSNPDDLINIVKANGGGSDSKRDIMVLMSIYRVITCSYRQPQQRLPEPQQFQEFLGQPENLSEKARQLAFKLLNNSHSEGFSGLSAQPDQPTATIDLSEIVVHTMIVLQCSNNNEVITTLKSLMNSPGIMKDSFLPTMPEDDFEKVRQGLHERVTWYECVNGHRYSIGDCGQANQESFCPECKSGIGGTGYKLLPGNRALVKDGEDRSNRGHILGKANAEAAEIVRDGLTPAAVYIMRLIMHSAMLVGICRKPEEAGQMFSPPVEDDDLHEFVWAHIARDLRSLATALNRSEEEALLTVHSVLQHMTECSESWTMSPGNGVLTSPANRKRWEVEFSSSFIEPVLWKLAEELQDCLTAIANDRPVGSDRLMREIYELEETDRIGRLSSMHPCFWRYRAKITVEHAKQMFSEKMANSKKHKVMRHFFKEEHNLRLARYIPEIYRLQQVLTDNFSRRIEKTNADKMTVKDFQESLTDKNKKAEFKALFASFRSAWRAIPVVALENQGRFKLSSETCSLPMNDKTPLSYLLPASNGHESCTTAVAFYLVNAHNEFLEFFHNHTYGNARNVKQIPDTEITHSQMLSYNPERDLLHIIHAHCHYSLKVGQGTVVEYDWTAIQRHLIDRLIRGKSLIVFKEAKFSFLRYNQANLFLNVRQKIKQENISALADKMISSQLREFQDVCEVKQSLELAIGFLATGGGDSRKLISEYLHDVLRIPQERGLRSQKAEQICQLRHIVNLWQIVTSEKAKILLRQKQDPFNDLPDSFKDKIPTTEIRDLKKSLKSVSETKQLSWDLIEMIALDLNKEKEQALDMSFQEYFNWFMEGSDREQLDINDSIKLKHVVNLWEIVVSMH